MTIDSVITRGYSGNVNLLPVRGYGGIFIPAVLIPIQLMGINWNPFVSGCALSPQTSGILTTPIITGDKQ